MRKPRKKLSFSKIDFYRKEFIKKGRKNKNMTIIYKYYELMKSLVKCIVHFGKRYSYTEKINIEVEKRKDGEKNGISIIWILFESEKYTSV